MLLTKPRSRLAANLRTLLLGDMILEMGKSWPIGVETAGYIADHATGCDSIETGIGHSTFIFAARSRRHTVCFKDHTVEGKVRNYASILDLHLSHVKFITGMSQHTLPKIEEHVDFALIDGDHMFPTPMIDWYYINNLLSLGGTLILDDTKIRSVGVLDNFLKTSKHWKHIATLDKDTSIFQKQSHDAEEWWGIQEYNL